MSFGSTLATSERRAKRVSEPLYDFVVAKARRISTLSPQHWRLAALIEAGASNREAATVLGITEGTAKVYAERICAFVGAKDRGALAAWYRKRMDVAPVVSDLPLTKRSRQIAALVHEGLTNRQIAQSLNLSYGTVKQYIHAIMRMSGVRNRVQLGRLVFPNERPAEVRLPDPKAAEFSPLIDRLHQISKSSRNATEAIQ